VLGLGLYFDTTMEAKIKHLEFVQAAINRMAGNSFLLKGWAVTLTGAALALTIKQLDRHYLIISLVVVALFWFLDSYYLSRERRFVQLYNQVRLGSDDRTDFSMDTKAFGKSCRWTRCAFSKTLIVFYGGLLVVHLLITHFI
jgi:hypothetical protein